MYGLNESLRYALLCASTSLLFAFYKLTYTRYLYFEPLLKIFFKNQNCSKNHKKSKLGHKVIIFISLERSCVTLHSKWLFS